MKDFRGTELIIGDRVATIQKNDTAPGGHLVEGIVYRFTRKFAAIMIANPYVRYRSPMHNVWNLYDKGLTMADKIIKL